MARWLLIGFLALSAESGKGGKKGKKENGIHTPEQRMDRLVTFWKKWTDDNIRNNVESTASQKMKDNLHDKLVDKVTKVSERMLSIYSNTNDDGEKRCGYFDPTTTYGGPQIDTPSLNEEKVQKRKEYLSSQRRRRHDLIVQFEGLDLTTKEWHKFRSEEDLDHLDEKIAKIESLLTNNVDENGEKIHSRYRRKAVGEANTRYSDVPLTGLKQITTGFRKWAERYIAYCGREYIERKFSKWATEDLWKKTEIAYKCKILGQDSKACNN